MAELPKVVRIGDTLTNLIDKNTNQTVTYTKVNNWWDGTPMTTSKADGEIYRRKGVEYFLKNLGKYGELFLEKDTMQEMRDINSTEILLLQMGYYKGVKLNGYYEAGDTPAPIEYYLSDTEEEDDGGSVFEVGGIKLEHDFKSGIDIRYYGAIGDGLADSTDAIQKVLNKGGRVFIKGGGTYLVDSAKDNGLGGTGNYGMVVRSNTFIQSDKNTILKSKPVSRTNYNVLLLVNCENVTIDSLIVHGDRDEHLGTTGEWGMGISTRTAKNVTINNVEVRDCWGDGICVSRFVLGEYSENIKITKTDVYRCRRQGLTVASVDGLYVSDSSFNETRGTAPQYGIDVEPDSPVERIANVFFNNVLLKDNAAGGFHTYLGFLDETSHPVSISLDNIKVINPTGGGSEGGYISFSFSGQHPTNYTDVKGVINATNLYTDNPLEKGIAISNWTSRPDLFISNVNIVNAGRGVVSANEDKYSGLRIWNQRDFEVVRKSNIVIKDINITMKESNNNLVRAAVFEDDTATSDNVFIDNIRVFNAPYGSTRVFNKFQSIINIGIINTTYRNSDSHFDNQALTTLSTKDYTSKRGFQLYPTQNNTIRVLHEGDFPVQIVFNNREGSFLNIEDSYGRAIQPQSKGATITMKRVEGNNWMVLNMTGTWDLINLTSLAVIDTIKPITNLANLTTSGLVSRSIGVSNITTSDATTDSASAATDVSGLVADFNDLITKYNVLVTLTNELKTQLNAKLTADRNSGQQAT